MDLPAKSENTKSDDWAKDLKSPSLYIDLGQVEGSHLRATVPLVFSSMEYAATSQMQISGWFDELKPWLVEYLYEAGHIRSDGANEDEAVEHVQNSFSCTYFMANPKQIAPSSEEMKFVLRWVMTALLLDDFMETTNVFRDSKTGGASEVSKLMSDILKGKYKSVAKLPKTYPAVMQFQKALFIIQVKGCELFPDFVTNIQYTIDQCTDSLEANRIISTEKKKAQDGGGFQPISPNTFESLRESDIGALFTLEIMALAAGISLNDSIRRNLLLRRLLRLFASLCATFNDIIGIKRDITNNGINAILYRMTTNPKLSLEQSFAYSVNKMALEMEEFKLIATKLRSIGNDKLNEYITLVEYIIHGTTVWSLQTKMRYDFDEIKFLDNKE